MNPSSAVSLVKYYQFMETFLTPMLTPLLFPPLFCECLQSVVLPGFALPELPFRYLLLKTAFSVSH